MILIDIETHAHHLAGYVVGLISKVCALKWGMSSLGVK